MGLKEVLKRLLLGDITEEEEPSEEEQEEEEPLEAEEGLRSTMGRWGPRLPPVPKLVGVVSSKGGVGKSTVAAGLVLLGSLYAPYRVAGVDLDPDNETLRQYLLRDETVFSRVENPLTFTMFLYQVSGRASLVPQRRPVETCRERIVEPTYYFVPFKVGRTRDSVMRMLGMEAAVNEAISRMVSALVRFTEKGVGFVVDCKQKSIAGVRAELLYQYIVPYSDALVVVTEPSYLGRVLLDEYLMHRTGKPRDSLVVVVNKYEPRYEGVVKSFLEEARLYGVRVFILPVIEKESLGVTEAGASRTFYYQSLLYLAYYLGMAGEKDLERSGCARAMERMARIYRALWGR